MKNHIQIFCVLMFLCGAAFADENPPWQQAGEWPDRIVATLASTPASSFSVNWRTEAAVTSTVAEIAPATAATRFDRAAMQIPAVSEGFEFDPAWLKGKRHGEGDELLIEPVTYHSVTFAGLQPDTLYAYRVQGAEGNWSAWRQLRTAPVGGPIEFLYFGDSQNGIRSHISRLFDTASVVSPGARFMLHTGDLVNSGLNDRQWAEWFEAGGSLFGRVPSIPVPGNHDHGSGGKYGLTPYWRAQFNLPVEPSLPESLHEAVYAMYYTPDLHLFAIDSTGPAFDKQLEWLGQQLQDSNARWRVVYMHHPFFSWVGEGIEKPDQTVRRAQLDKFLEQHDVDLVLTGHRHSYQRAESGAKVHLRDKHQPYEVETVFLVTASTIKRGRTKLDGWERFSNERDGNITLTRWGDDRPIFGVFSVDGDVLNYRGLDAVGDVYDAFTLHKQPDGRKVIENGKEAFGPVSRLQKTPDEYVEESTAGSKPNIVLVLADDQGWRDSGAYGNPDVLTPNIDALAGQGMKFTHAFTATAMCSPTRQQLYTGLYPVRSGAYPQNSQVRAGTRSLAHYFGDLGYRVGISGKRHYSPKESFPFESLNSPGVEHDKEAPEMNLVSEFVNRDSEQPFVLLVTSRQPHTPWNKGYVEYAPEQLTIPGNMVDTGEMRKALAAYYREVSDFDAELGRVMKIVDEAGQAENTIFIYTSEQGAMLPSGKWTLYDNGVRTAFVVRWPGVVEQGSETSALVAYVDVVPTLVEAAGGIAPDVDGESFLPVLRGEAPTHRDYVFGVHTSIGICNGAEYPIRSVRDARYKLIINGNAGQEFQNNITVRDPAGYYDSWRVAGEAGNAFAAERHAAYRIRPSEEFYDLVNDPLELNNLAGVEAYKDVRARLRLELVTWLEEQDDIDPLATERAATQRILPDGLLKLQTSKCRANSI